MKKILLILIILPFFGFGQSIQDFSTKDLKDYNVMLGPRLVIKKVPEQAGTTSTRRFFGNLTTDTLISGIEQNVNINLQPKLNLYAPKLNPVFTGTINASKFNSNNESFVFSSEKMLFGNQIDDGTFVQFKGKIHAKNGIKITGDIEYGIGGNNTFNNNIDFDKAISSGFYDSYNALNLPVQGWNHVLNINHKGVSDDINYSLQIGGSFFDQKLFFRKTANILNTAWTEIVGKENNIINASNGTWGTPQNQLNLNYLNTKRYGHSIKTQHFSTTEGNFISFNIYKPSDPIDVNGGLEVFKIKGDGSIELSSADGAIIIKSPNGNKFKITVNNSGVLTTTAL